MLMQPRKMYLMISFCAFSDLPNSLNLFLKPSKELFPSYEDRDLFKSLNFYLKLSKGLLLSDVVDDLY